MKFNKAKFSKEITLKMYRVMMEQQKKYGLRYFAKEIGVSLSTLHRVLELKDFDVKTLLALLTWLDMDFKEFIV